MPENFTSDIFTPEFIKEQRNLAKEALLPWGVCSCGKCGQVWSLPADFPILDTTAHFASSDAEGLPHASNERALKIARLITDSANHWIEALDEIEQLRAENAGLRKQIGGRDAEAASSKPYEGSRFVRVNSHITLGCISPEARELLDAIMPAWEEHLKAVKEHSPDYEPTCYGFAYWLVRYSGLITPKAIEEELRKDITRLSKLLETAEHALRSYQYGNGSPDLAQEVADKIAQGDMK